MKKTAHTIESLKTLAGTNDVYIYGAGPRGYIWRNYLLHHKFNLTGFIDQSKKGAGIFTPDILDSYKSGTKPFIIIAAQKVYADQIMTALNRRGLEKGIDYINGAQLYNTFPTIEVAGACNLRCVSCNLGSSFGGRKKGGLMSMGRYTALFEKLLREVPILPNLALYCWGEPLLNPELPAMIRYTQDRGVAVELSTNLNSCRTLETVIESSPAVVKVSCSGAGDHYERMHTGGKWPVFLENMHKLRHCIDRYEAATTVEVVYHAYKDNLSGDYDYVKCLADELGFMFYPIIATVFPESIFNHVVYGTPIPETMLRVSREMVYSIEDQIQYSRANRAKKCVFMKAFPTIRWDGSVIPCCNMEGGEIAANYQDTPLEELKAKQCASELCTKCIEHGLHLLCTTNGRIEYGNGVRRIIKL